MLFHACLLTSILGLTGPSTLGPRLDGDASTSTFQYDFVDAGLSLGDLSGLSLDGSYRLDGPWLAVGSFEYLTDDSGVIAVDLTRFSGGAGYVLALDEGFDFVGTAGLEYGNADVTVRSMFGSGSASSSSIGVRARGGVRYAMSPEIELNGGLGFRTIFSGDITLDAGAIYQLTPRFAGYARIESADDSLFTVGIRYSL